MNTTNSDNRASKMFGLIFVIVIHIGLLYLAMSYKLIAPPQEAVTLMVSLINPPKKVEPPPPKPPKPVPPKEVTLVKEKPVIQPKPAPVIVAQAPVVVPSEPVVPPPPVKPEPAPSAPEPVAVEVKPALPVQISELSVACASRPEPTYPAISKRLGEQGMVKLRVELDEQGHIVLVKVIESSGHSRLDNAGLNTVKNWKCEAVTRDGKPSKAIATQVFDFKLE